MRMTRMSREEKKIKEEMEERAEEAIESESEEIKRELESGKMEFNERRIKDRLESAAKEAIEEVKNEVSGALVLGATKVGEYFYPISKPVSVKEATLVVPVVVAAPALAKLAAAAFAAVTSIAVLSEYEDDLKSWWEGKLKRQRELEVAGAEKFKEMAGIEPDEYPFYTPAELKRLKEIEKGVDEKELESAAEDLADQANDAARNAGEAKMEEVGKLVAQGLLSERAARTMIDEVVKKAIEKESYKKKHKYPRLAHVWDEVKEHAGLVGIAVTISGGLFAVFEIGEIRRAYEFSAKEKDALEAIGYTAREYEDDKDWSGLKDLFPEWEALLDEYEDFVDEHKIILYHPEGHYSIIRTSRVEMERLVEKVETGAAKEEKWLGPCTGKVTKVNDGDTFVMQTDEIDPATGSSARLTIRIEGLECPERGEEGYKYATEILRDMILGRRVEVDIVKPTGGWSGDRYVADVTCGGSNLARAMIRATGGVCK